MGVIQALQGLMACGQVDGSQSSHALLEEKDSSAKLKKLTLSEFSAGMLLLEIDEGRKVNNAQGKRVMDCLSPLFKTDADGDQNRACDAVLVRELQNNQCEIFYIDLKSDKPSGYQGQFKSTQCFMRYVFDVLEKLYDQKVCVQKERFVVFHTDSSDVSRRGIKTRTSFKPSSANTPKAPTMYCVVNNATVRCTELL